MYSQVVPISRRKLSWDERVSMVTSFLVDLGIIAPDAAPIVDGALRAFNRKLEMSKNYTPKSRVSWSTRVTLIRASETATQKLSLGDDYGVGDVIDGDVTINDVIGSHESFMASDDGAVRVAALIDASVRLASLHA